MNEEIKKFQEELEAEWNAEKEKYDSDKGQSKARSSQFYLDTTKYIEWRLKVIEYIENHFSSRASKELLSFIANLGITESIYKSIQGTLNHLLKQPIGEFNSKIKKIIILTGAGIPNLFGLPMTSEFKSLISESAKHELRVLLSDYLADDIEKVMYALEDCIKKEDRSLQEHILNANKFFPYTDNVNVNQIVRNKYQEIKNNVQNSLSYLKTGIYNDLNKFDLDKASNLYYSILEQIKTKYPDSMISIFTTNYDLSFERACRSNKENLKNIKIDTDKIDYGFVLQDDIMVFDPNGERKYLEYYKLHGSLDWHYDDLGRCTKSGANASPLNPDTMPILYPGIKGKPQKDPFIKLHDIFFERLQNADIVIVMGFAFRDPYINYLIRFSKMTNKKYKMLYFNPTKKNDLPKESGIHEFIDLFEEDLKYINSRIEIKDNPLGDFLD